MGRPESVAGTSGEGRGELELELKREAEDGSFGLMLAELEILGPKTSAETLKGFKLEREQVYL